LAWRRRRDLVIFPAATDGFHSTRLVSAGPFVMVPRALVYADDVSAEAKVCWSVLQDATRGAEAWIGTTSQLARLLGLEERQGRRLAQQLVAAGWLEVGPVGRRGNRYRLLGRARPVDNPGVDVGPGGTSMSPQPGAWPVTNVRGHGVPTSLHTREEAQGQIPLDWSGGGGRRAPRGRPSWCGRCDEPTRHLEVDAGAYRRCPDCHPLSVPAF
jgi:hypothetical protein